MKWPKCRLAPVTVPPRSGITSAGQHQAPIKAGIDKTSVKSDMNSPRLSAAELCPSSSPQPSDPSGSRGASSWSPPPPDVSQSVHSTLGWLFRCDRGTNAQAMTSPSSFRTASGIVAQL
eukprot:2276277-Rhodomonas_salina.4